MVIQQLRKARNKIRSATGSPPIKPRQQQPDMSKLIPIAKEPTAVPGAPPPPRVPRNITQNPDKTFTVKQGNQTFNLSREEFLALNQAEAKGTKGALFSPQVQALETAPGRTPLSGSVAE